jgi:tRNA threonylcarbamoyladenosine biosynthesis protein TsaB
MRILALDATLTRASAALWLGGAVHAAGVECGGRGQPAILPGLVQQVLAEAGLAAAALDAVVVGVGPGGFSGLRAAAALAGGIALGAGCPVHGVAARDSLAHALADRTRGFALWLALAGSGGRIILARPGAEPESLEERALPAPPGPVAVAGDASIPVVARLTARGAMAMLLGRVTTDAADVARCAAAALADRAAGVHGAGAGSGRDGCPAGAARAAVLRPALPLYAEAPSVRLPG